MVPAVSQLSLVTQPGNVQVYLDDKFKGVTSEDEGKLVIDNLAPGIYQLRLSLPGYKQWKQQVTLQGGQMLPVSARLEAAGPEPLSFEEVEKALKNGISKKKVMEWVKQFGVDFAITPEREAGLRDAGADDAVLYAITQAKK